MVLGVTEAEHNRQVFVVNDVLVLSSHNASGFLEDPLIIPVSVHVMEDVCNAVVLAGPDDVHERQTGVLIETTFAREERTVNLRQEIAVARLDEATSTKSQRFDLVYTTSKDR